MYDSTGSYLASSSNYSYSSESVTHSVTAGQTYYICIDPYYNAYSNYNLTVTIPSTTPTTDDYAASTSTTGSVTVGSSSSGRIETGGDHDWFRVYLSSGTTYQLKANSTTLSDPVLYLHNSSGTALSYNDDGGGGVNALISYSPTTSGYYHLDVSGYSTTETGYYTVSATASSTTPTETFDIELVYTGPSQYRTYFDQAVTILENVITTGLPAVGSIDDLKVNAGVIDIDGSGDSDGNTLAHAWVDGYRSGSTGLPYEGTIEYDSYDISSMISKGIFGDVVLHEMIHTLGFGTLWSRFGLNSNFGRYTGANALAEYKSLSGNSSATYVPLEDGGGSGTANVHWEEQIFGNELMTGYSPSSGNAPLSRLTIAALKDLGYSVNYSAAEYYALPSSSVATVGVTGADVEGLFII